MKTPILYSFVRFRPYIETGEFVNVGLLMCEPQTQKLTFGLVPKNSGRVNHFFYNSRIFEEIRDTINSELKYIKKIVENDFRFSPEEVARFFHNFVDCKEGIVQYSNAVVGVVDDPQANFSQLYREYIHFGGVKSVSQENNIVREFKDLFKAQSNPIFNNYKECLVKGETSKFKLPLALKDNNDNKVIRGIKPLAFDQNETASMIEHCDSWVAKINRSTAEGLIKKDCILFALDTANTKAKIKILDTIKRTFDHFSINHTDWKNKEEVLDFAKDVTVF
ncbi:DUF3037 domain-containing protein [Phocoenobacter skyensis]|uniref:DUF3037 domain-containing protein n=1 Tax=Phocoenobacter skyensis TaxID=97481 RepID=A0A1H7Y1D2_9PAST|nr:DUF3037 domain-containing protein [Pasteurella skyensis]MDP8079768.1 DUF3037 domain-containing protein [Pasteurella skyensis]MDP8085763.1 DUF3037 domain-containing protein [Pasteurella skyensis]MDP8185591.1 DUF3037 domain-containing protein [Pasteurella skyensis]QLB21847.1 hypothetical protein A6B44_00925 [Pasteurella skyensis]SEM39715.1 Protein of unknown function [Pasteurella skyensis]